MRGTIRRETCNADIIKQTNMATIWETSDMAPTP